MAIQDGPEVIFRVDASLAMGSGHVMRCLTLADTLHNAGKRCLFICREHVGHMIDIIRERGHPVEVLPRGRIGMSSDRMRTNRLLYEDWLGVGQDEDAAATAEILVSVRPEWLIVDHYAINVAWEVQLSAYCHHLMVIDDLADRRHSCDLLLDQTLGRDPNDYASLVLPNTRLLCGAQYALVRPEFTDLRTESLKRREGCSRVQRVLISLGGVDSDNVTGAILDALSGAQQPDGCQITVVLGWRAPRRADVYRCAERLSLSVNILDSVSQMAQLMKESDLSIGAAGATAWERCCLGLPTIAIVLADNQRGIARSLEESGAAIVCTRDEIETHLATAYLNLVRNPIKLNQMSFQAAAVCDGWGRERVSDAMEAIHAARYTARPSDP